MSYQTILFVGTTSNISKTINKIVEVSNEIPKQLILTTPELQRSLWYKVYRKNSWEWVLKDNKLASLEASLVWNYDRLTHKGKV